MKKILLVILTVPTLLFGLNYMVHGNYSYPIISGVSNGNNKIQADWGVGYDHPIIDRLYATIAYNNTFWIPQGRETGTDYDCIEFGLSCDIWKAKALIINVGLAGGQLFYVGPVSNAEHWSYIYQGVFPHYVLSISPRIPLNDVVSFGLKYSLNNGTQMDIFKNNVNTIGIDAMINIAEPIHLIEHSMRIQSNCSGMRVTGYDIAGYSLLSLGLICTTASLLCFAILPRFYNETIGIPLTIGAFSFGGGACLELLSIAFFATHKKMLCGN